MGRVSKRRAETQQPLLPRLCFVLNSTRRFNNASLVQKMAMEVFEVLSSVLSVLRQENVPVCIIGEVALNYYNVPRVVHVRNVFPNLLEDTWAHHS